MSDAKPVPTWRDVCGATVKIGKHVEHACVQKKRHRGDHIAHPWMGSTRWKRDGTLVTRPSFELCDGCGCGASKTCEACGSGTCGLCPCDCVPAPALPAAEGGR